MYYNTTYVRTYIRGTLVYLSLCVCWSWGCGFSSALLQLSLLQDEHKVSQKGTACAQARVISKLSLCAFDGVWKKNPCMVQPTYEHGFDYVILYGWVCMWMRPGHGDGDEGKSSLKILFVSKRFDVWCYVMRCCVWNPYSHMPLHVCLPSLRCERALLMMLVVVVVVVAVAVLAVLLIFHYVGNIYGFNFFVKVELNGSGGLTLKTKKE